MFRRLGFDLGRAPAWFADEVRIAVVALKTGDIDDEIGGEAAAD